MRKTSPRKIALVLVVAAFAFYGVSEIYNPEPPVLAQQRFSYERASITPVQDFDQAVALAKLREQIKGRENEPAGTVFKDLKILKEFPASRVLAVMEFGFSRSLGVNCTHCHTTEKWESDEKPTKQVARDMWAMVSRINGELLKNVKNLKSENPAVNCTTCHRGQVIPALNLPAPSASP